MSCANTIHFFFLFRFDHCILSNYIITGFLKEINFFEEILSWLYGNNNNDNRSRLKRFREYYGGCAPFSGYLF